MSKVNGMDDAVVYAIFKDCMAVHMFTQMALDNVKANPEQYKTPEFDFNIVHKAIDKLDRVKKITQAFIDGEDVKVLDVLNANGSAVEFAISLWGHFMEDSKEVKFIEGTLAQLSLLAIVVEME